MPSITLGEAATPHSASIAECNIETTRRRFYDVCFLVALDEQKQNPSDCSCITRHTVKYSSPLVLICCKRLRRVPYTENTWKLKKQGQMAM
jgi:hypothetical protein